MTANRRFAVRVSAHLPWSKWTAEFESAVRDFASELAQDFGHRARWSELDGSDRDRWHHRWHVSAYITARSAREGEEIRRAGVWLARERRLEGVQVEF